MWWSLPLTRNEMFKGDIGNITCPEGSHCSHGACYCYGGRVGPNCDICKSKLMHLVKYLHFTSRMWWYKMSLSICSHSMQQTALPTWYALTTGAVTTWMVQVCVCVGLHSLGMTAHKSFQVSGLASFLCKCCMLHGCHVSHSVGQMCAYANCGNKLGHLWDSPACVH